MSAAYRLLVFVLVLSGCVIDDVELAHDEAALEEASPGGQPVAGATALRSAKASTFRAAVVALPGLEHYYPLTATHRARDTVGSLHGTAVGVTFEPSGATFGGDQYIELPDHDDFSVTTTGALTIVAFVRVSDWKENRQGGEYVHWLGKGVPGAHEWTFRYYPDDHPDRPRRVSFYHFNPAGGLGAGSYFQDDIAAGTELMVVGNVDLAHTRIFRDGVLRDADALGDLGISPHNTTTPVRIGTRDLTTGFLVGKVRRVAFYSGTLTAAQLGSLWSARGRPEG